MELTPSDAPRFKVGDRVRDNKLIYEQNFGGSIRDALSFAPLAMTTALEGGKVTEGRDDHLCFQPACPNEAVVEYELVEEFGRQGERLHPEERSSFSMRRRFCAKHKTRGDCGREDCDANYRPIESASRDRAGTPEGAADA